MLEEYLKKRNFKKSIEPKGSAFAKATARRGTSRIFVVQEHHANHLHWDFRLEQQGVLKSWAVPKGMPINKGEEKLALAVEDHPLGYADFEGEIKKGEYGAGKVKIWDNGTYNLIRLEANLWEIELKGKQLKGIYVLFHPKKFEKNNWLLMKK